MIVTAQAPVRVDFGGAWTDVDLYARDHGGVVFNATLNHYVSGSRNVYESGEGSQSREGLEVRYGFDLPTGSGLGTSASLNVCWFALIGQRSATITDSDRRRISEQSYGLEELLGNLGGRQDQYAAAFGGFNLMRFGGGADVVVEKITPSQATIESLEQRSVLIYTGKPRLSGGIHENVWGAFRAGRPETVAAFHRLRALGEELPQALRAGDLAGFATLLAENWRCQQALDSSVSNPQIEGLFAAARAAGALGGKACGAGGGGCLYFVTEEGRQAEVTSALVEAGASPIPLTFEFEGLTLAYS